MRRHGVILLALGCAALAAAQEAPLAGSKKQLQQLGKDQTNEKAGVDGGLQLRNALPLPKTPANESLPMPDPRKLGGSENDAGARRRADARKNWLIDGVDRLDRRNRAGSVDGAQGKSGKEETPLDPSDPDYFLRVYEKQRTDNLAKQQEQRDGSARITGGSPDAFTPFLQNWLAGSPVKEALRDTLEQGRRGDSAGSVANPVLPVVDPRPADTGQYSLSSGAASGPAAKAADNPFVQALGLPTGGTATTEFRSPVAAPVLAPSTPSPRYTPLPEAPRIETRRGPPPSPADDKKYFPQLKKF